MNPELKAKWIAALRSGEYEQTTGALCRIGADDGKERYCCLGVLCQVAGFKRVESDRRVGYIIPGDDLAYAQLGRYGYLPPNTVPHAPQDILISMNDGSEASFAEIADYIEKNL